MYKMKSKIRYVFKRYWNLINMTQFRFSIDYGESVCFRGNSLKNPLIVTRLVYSIEYRLVGQSLSAEYLITIWPNRLAD